MANDIRLNVGAGSTEIPGFVPLDIQDGTDVTEGLPYEDGSVAEIYCSHTLEHIHHSKTAWMMEEFARVLKPGGLLRIAVPDWSKIEDQHKSGLMGDELYQAWVYGSYDAPHDRHLARFTSDSLVKAFCRAGFDDVRRWEPEYEDCSRLPASLNLCGIRREVRIGRSPVVAMVLSSPRLGFCDFFESVYDVAKSLGWPLIRRGGTEWGRGLTQACRKAIDDYNPDYIMALDYDSAFTAEDCQRLLDIMQENPQIGALFPVQQHRHLDCPLGYNTAHNTPKYTGGLTEMASGHFGCTIIRRQVFETVPQPWFMTLPNPVTADMGNEALDADIFFWLNIREHGWRIFQADTVTIGHIELSVKWPKGDGTGWQPIQHYNRHGRPEWAKLDGPGLNSRREAMPVKKAEDHAAVEKLTAIREAARLQYHPNGSPELART